MNFQQALASQLSHPRGIPGKYLLGSIWNIRNRELNALTLNELELSERDRIIEIGFGGGYLLGRIIPNVTQGMVVGLDASQVMVETCRLRFKQEIKTGKLWICSGQAEAQPFADGHFTKVCSVNSIFYWSHIQQGIAEIFRILKGEGKVILTFTCKRDLEKRGFAQCGVKTLDHEEVWQLITEAGFEDVRIVKSRDRHREFVCMTARKP